MKLDWRLRAFIMTIGFLGTVHAIRLLDRTHKAEKSGGKTVNLCPTRVTSITAADGSSVAQEGMAWYRKISGRMEELDPIAVEKWFGSHCVVDADEAETPTGQGDPVATLAFVNGPPQVLFSNSSGIYTFMGEAFSSGELTDALKSLPEIPIRLRPSR